MGVMKIVRSLFSTIYERESDCPFFTPIKEGNGTNFVPFTFPLAILLKQQSKEKVFIAFIGAFNFTLHTERDLFVVIFVFYNLTL